MGIDIIHRLRRNTGIFQGAPHRERGPGPLGVRSGHMVGIAADSVPQDLAVNTGSPLPGMRQRLEDHDTGAFAQGKPLSVFIKRLAVLRVHGLQGVEGRIGDPAQRFGAAADDDRRHICLNEIPGVTDSRGPG